MHILKAQIQNMALREDTLDGKPHIVFPVVLMVEGVHTGLSGTPYYYPTDELEHSVPYWNGVPVPVHHPTTPDGEPLSANNPQILTERNVGRLFNVSFEENKLKGEIWIDPEHAERVSPGLVTELRGETTMEVSTGLYFDEKKPGGTWNGEEYQAIAYNYVPDHLALLPGAVGACSFQDGCGVRANQTEDKKEATPMDERDPDGILKRLVRLLAKGIGMNVSEDEETETQETPETNEATEDPDVNTAQEDNMQKEELVTGLIANEATKFTDDDKEWLMALAEDQLAKLCPCPNEAEEDKDKGDDDSGRAKPETNEEPPKDDPPAEPQPEEKPMSLEEYVSKAPSDFREILQQLLADNKAKKEALIKALVDNKDCQFTKEELATSSIDALEKLSALAKVNVDYSGKVGGPSVNDDAVPPMPAVFDLTRKSA